MPGAFHRRIAVTPGPGPEPRIVSAWVEDDYHHMGVTLRHDGTAITSAGARIVRAPWSTCPGAEAALARTFAGAALGDAARAGDRTGNCTHLYDMAVLAAAHAGDAGPTDYALRVSDADGGVRVAEAVRDGRPVLRIVERDGLVVEPAEAAGATLFRLGPWIAPLDPAAAEAARLLRWAAIVAHGRAIPMDRQSDATRMPPACFTFQPGRRERADRVGAVRDFSDLGGVPRRPGPGAAGSAA